MFVVCTPEAFEDVMKIQFDKTSQAEIIVDSVGEAIFIVDGVK